MPSFSLFFQQAGKTNHGQKLYERAMRLSDVRLHTGWHHFVEPLVIICTSIRMAQIAPYFLHMMVSLDLTHESTSFMSHVYDSKVVPQFEY
jgi:hypothetical protein